VSSKTWQSKAFKWYGRCPQSGVSFVLTTASAPQIWMMGVWHLGEYGLNYDKTNAQLLQQYATTLPGYTQADIIGSPYAITNYTMNPVIGTSQDLANLRKTLNNLGIQLCIDFVPNHSGRDVLVWCALACCD